MKREVQWYGDRGLASLAGSAGSCRAIGYLRWKTKWLNETESGIDVNGAYCVRVDFIGERSD